MDNYIGKLLDNRYEILEVIGTGGMAVVYKALCHRLNRLVAVKILKDEFSRDQDFRRRFHAESQAVAMLSHPNIVSVYDVSTSGDSDYIVMELIDGITLKQYMERKGRLNWRETLHFSMQMTKALEHAHGRGIVHRDIKPHNIMILKDGSIKVADFGIARIAAAQNTLTREALGSVHYISPEQAKGARVDNRSDLYSLGVVMYEMLTGHTPYDGETPVSVAIQHINGGAKAPSVFVEGIPLGLEQITLHAMEADVSARYTSAAEILRDMEEFRKNPSMLFAFDAIVPQVAQTPEPRPAQSDAQRYAEQRKAARGASRLTPEQRAERERRAALQQEKIRRRNRMIGIGVGAALAVILLIVLAVTLLSGGDDPSATVDEVIVPKFVGMEFQEIDPADYPELIVDVENAKYEYNDEYEAGFVYEQSPKEGELVPGGGVRRVTLYVSLGEETNLMPDLTNQSESAARSQLAAINLGLKVKVEEEASDTVVAGYVTRTEPAANAELEEGQEVTVFVSLGSTKMPELKGQSKANAGALLDAMKLNLKVTYLEEDSENVEEGYVTRTTPSSGTDLSKGQQITVYISKGSSKISVPQLTGMNYLDAIQLLQSSKLGYNVTYSYSETVAKGRVISQDPTSGTKVDEKTVITLVVSDGPTPTEPPTQPPTEPPTNETEPPTAP